MDSIPKLGTQTFQCKYPVLHNNFVIQSLKYPSGTPPAPSTTTEEYTPAEKAALERTKLFKELGSGYSKEQSTQPQTLGYSLADSPVGLLAWIYEKLVNWTDDYPWEDDEGLCGASFLILHLTCLINA